MLTRKILHHQMSQVFDVMHFWRTWFKWI